jgi:uncharacterized membrane protein
MDPTTPAASPPPAAPAASDITAKIVYILYLVSLVVGVTSIVGVILAYVNVGDAPEPLRSHYRFQIRTFWIGVLYALVSLVLTLVVVGAIGFVFVVVWLVVRCVKGLRYLDRREPYPNAATWLW